MDASELWSGFPQDPREPASADLRASDADRDRIQSLLGDAFADGRLDREEYDERTGTLLATRTLGGLPPLVADLVSTRSRAALPARRDPSGELDLRVQRHWESERRQAVFGFLGPTLITWVIWVFISFGPAGFDPSWPWPAIVTVATGLHLARTLASKDEIVDRERRRLEKKQTRKDPGELE